MSQSEGGLYLGLYAAQELSVRAERDRYNPTGFPLSIFLLTGAGRERDGARLDLPLGEYYLRENWMDPQDMGG